MFQPLLNCNFRNFDQRNIYLTVSVQQNSLQRAMSCLSQKLKPHLCTLAALRASPAPLPNMSGLCTRDFSHTCSIAVWSQEQIGLWWDLAGMDKIWSRLPKERAQQHSCGLWGVRLPLLGSSWSPAACGCPRVPRWHRFLGIIMAVPWLHVMNGAHPHFLMGIIAFQWLRKFPRHQKVQVQDCGTEGLCNSEWSGIEEKARAMSWQPLLHRV